MSNSEPASQIAHKSLPRVLGLFDATTLVVGSIIGSGIFLKVGKVDQALMEDTARRIAARRVSPEGREGLAAFFDKRKASWIS